MTCPKCGTENPADRKFCGECGHELSLRCPACHAPNEPRFKFCGECGTALMAEGGAPSPTSGGPVSERRLVTVLFADLVGFTSLSEERDSDEVRDILSGYFDSARGLIERYGGTVEKFIGDAVMAVWGTPVAQEDDAERAVRAALDLIDGVRVLGQEAGADLRVRAGVLTGEAAVTLGATHQGMVAGDLVNTASRVQSAAEAGTVLVDEATRRGTEAAVAYEEAGLHELKGKVEPIRLHRALRVIGGRAGALRSVGLEAPFVGRDRELRLVKDLFHAAADTAKAHLLSVMGIAGIGKSRVAWEFFKYIDGLPQLVWWHRGRCLSYGDGVTYWALAEMVRGRAGIGEGEEPATATQKLRAALEEHVVDPDERSWVEPRLAHLLGLEERTAREPEDLFSAWRLFFERLAETNPTVLVFEDMQWADPSLLEFIDYLMTWSRNHAMFVLALARPELSERNPDWPTTRRAATTLHLEPLEAGDMDRLLAGLVPGLPDSMKQRILERAEGVPLYAVETVRMLLDRELLKREGAAYRVTGHVESLAIPETLHALIAARLDSLDSKERALIQEAAVLGKTFKVAALAALTGLSEQELQAHLASLVRKEILGLQADLRSPEHGQYGFLQDLVRKVAYDTLARKERKAKHLAAAEHMRATWGSEDVEVVEVIASHYVEAYRAAPDAADAPQIKSSARDALVQAGERSESLAAAAQALTYYRQAIELTDDPVTLATLNERAGVVGFAAGWRVEDLKAWFERAIELFEAEGRPLEAARVVAQLGDVAFGTGRLEEALSRVEEAYRVLSGGEPTEVLATVAGQVGRLLLFTGEPDRGLERIEEALQLAESLDLPEVFAQALNSKGVILSNRGRFEEGLLLLRHSLELALENELPSAALRAYNNLSSTVMQADLLTESLEVARRGVEYARRMGARRWEHKLLAGQVFTLTVLGRWDEAVSVAEELDASGEDIAGFQGIMIELMPRIEILVHRGELAEARKELDRFRVMESSEDMQAQSGFRYYHALLLKAEGKLEEAGKEIGRALAAARAMGTGFGSTRVVLELQAEIALSRGDLEGAGAVIEEAGSPGFGRELPSTRAFREWLSGRISAARGESEGVEEHFAEAARRFRDLGVVFWLGVTLLEHAEWLGATGRLGEGEPLLVEARDIFRRLRAQPWLARAERAGETIPTAAVEA